MKKVLRKMRREEHPRCFVCSSGNERGFKLDCEIMADQSIGAFFTPSDALEGYSNVMHGGAISALLDSVMTNCLFAHGIKALTAELNVRFLAPVRTNTAVELKAGIERSNGSYYIVNASLAQDKILKARAIGKFIEFFKRT